MTTRTCHGTTTTGQPCRNRVANGRPDCGRHTEQPTWTWGGSTGLAGLTDAQPQSDPMGAPADTARPVAPTGPNLFASIPAGASNRDHAHRVGRIRTETRSRQATELRGVARRDGVTIQTPSYKPGADAVHSLVAINGTTVGAVAGTLEQGVAGWRTERHIGGTAVRSHRSFPTAQAALDDLTAPPDPTITGRFGQYGPHATMGYDDAMALIRSHNGHVTRHDTGYGTPGQTMVDADLWRDGVDQPVLSITVTYDDTGAEVRAWWPDDTYASASALAEVTAHMDIDTPNRTAA